MKKKRILVIDLEYCLINANTIILKRIISLLRMKYDVDVATYDIGGANYKKSGDIGVITIPYFSLNKSRNTASIGMVDAMKLGFFLFKKRFKIGATNEKDIRYFLSEINKKKCIEEYSLIISFSNPFISHEIAGSLSDRYGLPWIAYYFDPYFSNSTLEKSGLLKRKEEEEKVVGNASVVMLTYPIDKDYCDRGFAYLKNVVNVEMPGIRDDMYLGRRKKYSNITQCYFVGNLYSSIRNPEWVLKLFSHLDGVAELSFVGGCYGDKDLLKKLEGDNIHYLGRKTQRELMEIYKDADVLINIGNLVTNQMPSKIFEYISSGKPIINIYKNEACPTLKYIQRYPLGINVYEEDIKVKVSGVARKVKKFFKEISELSVTKEEINSIFIENRDSSVADKLIKEIERLV